MAGTCCWVLSPRASAPKRAVRRSYPPLTPAPRRQHDRIFPTPGNPPMDAAQVFTIGQQALYTLLTVAAPVLVVVLVVGILVSIFQAATQINEATLTFVPKLLAA